MSRLAAITSGILALGITVCECREQIPVDKPVTDITQGELTAYALDIGYATFFIGIGPSFVIGLIMTLCCFKNTCCNRKKADKKPEEERDSTVDGVYDTEDMDMDVQVKPKKQSKNSSFFCLSFLHVLVYAALAYYIYIYAGRMNESSMHVYGGVSDMFRDLSSAVCSSDDTGACDGESVGEFVEDTKTYANNTLNTASSFLNDVLGIVDIIETVKSDIVDAVQPLETLSQETEYVAGNVTEIFLYLGYVSNPSYNGISIDLSGSLPATSLFPEVQDSDFDSLNSAIASANDSISEINVVLSETSAALTNSTIADVLVEIAYPAVEGSTRGELMDQINSLLESVYSARNQTVSFYDFMIESESDVEYSMELTARSLALLFFLPGLLQLFFTCCSGMKTFRKGCCNFPLACHMNFVYWFQFFYCVVPGFMLLFYYLNYDICEQHMDLIKVNLDYNFSISSNEISLAEKLPELMTCSGDENIPSIVDSEEMFNVTEYVAGTLSDIKQAQEDFLDSYNSSQSTADQFSDVSSALSVDFITGSDINEAYDQIESLLVTLPDVDPDRTDSDQQTKLYDVYLNTLSPAFLWSDYETIVSDMNTILAAMSPSNPIGITLTLNDMSVYTSAYFAADTNTACTGSCSGQDTDGGTWTYTGSDAYSTLDAYAQAADVYTVIVNSAVILNNDVRTNLTIISNDIVNVNNSISVFQEVQVQMESEIDSILAQLDVIVEITDISVLVTALDELIAFVSTGPEYLKCAFVGKFYEQTYKVYWCEETMPDLHALAGVMNIISMMLLVSYLLFNRASPKMTGDMKIVLKNPITSQLHGNDMDDDDYPIIVPRANQIGGQDTTTTPNAPEMQVELTNQRYQAAQQELARYGERQI